jgi:hypothetical protein
MACSSDRNRFALKYIQELIMNFIKIIPGDDKTAADRRFDRQIADLPEGPVRQLAEAISSVCYRVEHAAWSITTSRNLWHALTIWRQYEDQFAYLDRQGFTVDDMEELERLSKEAGGWIHLEGARVQPYDPGVLQFVTFDEWQTVGSDENFLASHKLTR